MTKELHCSLGMGRGKIILKFEDRLPISRSKDLKVWMDCNIPYQAILEMKNE